MSHWGKNLSMSVFGQSHAAAIGVTIDGLPAGEAIDIDTLQAFMDRRAPGQNKMTTQRKEPDAPEILCGVIDGVTCGAPLTAVIRNTDTRSKDYKAIADKPRPSHADWPAHVKYAGFQDVRGGGAFSARLTAPVCIAGGIALQILARRGIHVAAHILSIGAAQDRPFNPMGEDASILADRLTRPLAVLSNEVADAFANEIEAARKSADSIGGVIECMVTGLPVGLGGPLFDGIDGRLAQAVFGIPGIKGVAFGEGFNAAKLRGSQNNDPWGLVDDEVVPLTNHAGGVAGGMTTGAPLIFSCALKPTPSIGQSQQTISIATREATDLKVVGRHDPCIVVRAVPIVEAVAAITILDALLDAPAVLN